MIQYQQDRLSQWIIGSPTTEYGVIEALEEKSLFYYDINDLKFISTSYPVKVYLGINLHNANIPALF